MKQKTKIWNVIWQVVEFILTLGISHIAKRKKRVENNSTEEGGASDLNSK